MLFELRPDLFPQPWLTDAELELWELYLEERKRERDAARQS
jgi:hypothetical protein